MQKINNIRHEWQQLDKEDKDFFRFILIFFIPITWFLLWLVSTNTYPRLDAKKTDTQTHVKTSYELKGIYKQYAQGVYNRKYEK